MKKFFSTILWSLCLVLVASCSKDAEVLTGSISGFVSDYTNANTAIAGATVTLNSMGRTKTTGSDGRYEFTDLEPGTYSISVSANEYQTTTKQVTVYAGQNANCDFQLEGGSVSVDIDPVNITFGSTIDQLSFNIKNKSNKSLNYTISNLPDYVEVSPASASVSAKGTQAVTVKIKNRSTITSTKSGQITINIGSDSYTISVNVEPFRSESISADINPQNLSFGAETEQLTFTIVNNNTYGWNYSVSSNLSFMQVEPASGTIASGAKNTITVTIKDRKSIDSDKTGQINIEIQGNTYAIPVSIAKYEEGGGDTPGIGAVTRGLLAFYSFDDETADDLMENYDGFLTGGTFITDTSNGSGKALHLKKNEYVTIGDNPVKDKSSYSVNMWVKDYGGGVLLRTSKGDRINYSPSLMIDDEGYLLYTLYYSGGGGIINKQFSTKVDAFHRDQWTMLTVVRGEDDVILYANGQRIEVFNGRIQLSSQGTMMYIGGMAEYIGNNWYQDGYWTDPMKIDNVRIYGVALTNEEVKAIYTEESGK